MPPVRLALLGAGRIGRVHAHAISLTENARLISVSDPVRGAAEAIAIAHDAEVRTIEANEAADDIDAVLICTPNTTHADLIERFARAGKAVFCEKPIDLSVARVRTCLEFVERTGTTLMVGFHRRFDPDFTALKTAIDEGRIGDVEMITLTSRDPYQPSPDYIRTSGGLFRDMTIHDFDVARWLLGEEIRTVQAVASVLTDPAIAELGDFDSGTVLLATASGRQCTITNTRRASYGYDQRIEVHGSLGAVSAGNRHRTNIEIATADGYLRAPLLGFFMDRYTLAYAAEMAAFVEAVANGSPVLVTGHDGLAALELAEAAHSAATEGRVVRLSEVHGHSD